MRKIRNTDAQVGAWMRNSQKFFDVCVHPCRRSQESTDFPDHAQFCCRLLDLVVTKVDKKRFLAIIITSD
jgi:hypothetical protein